MFYLHDQLMGARHQGEAVGVVEGFGDVLSKGVAGTSGRDAPPTTVVGVRPQQVTHWALREVDGGSGLAAVKWGPLQAGCSSASQTQPKQMTGPAPICMCVLCVCVPHVGLLAGGPELVCDPECLWMEINLRGDRRSAAGGKLGVKSPDDWNRIAATKVTKCRTCPSTSAVSGR